METWQCDDERVFAYEKGAPFLIPTAVMDHSDPWLNISRGRYFTELDRQWLQRDLDHLDADIIAVTVDPELNGYAERTCYTSSGHIAGYRRRYMAATRLEAIPETWPHHLFIRRRQIGRIFKDDVLPLDFQQLTQLCRQGGCQVKHLRVPGQLADLHQEQDLLNGLRDLLLQLYHRQPDEFVHTGNGYTVHPTARLYGPILLSPNVRVGENAVLVGPTLIGRDATIGDNVIIRSSIITAGVTVDSQHCADNQWLTDSSSSLSQTATPSETRFEKLFQYYRMVKNATGIHADKGNYRTWSRFSYARFGKRFADILLALIVLSLFAPFIPILAIIIKLSSPGPVFFGHRRQGRHGKPFTCWKFRTMIPGADDLQDSLRVLNEVDGPQFRIEDDPRINAVGRFLRETFIDEIPQFFNVLLGQMSIVGPRPSPEKENALCAPWRDARLSVRPGVTGLWQVCRTRRAATDFQEWVYYDTEYVKSLTWKFDLLICWRTFKQMAQRFFDQF